MSAAASQPESLEPLNPRPLEPSVIVFTDGAAKGNPGPGGWGVVIATPDGRVSELGGGSRHTTNNQMELTGAIQALRAKGATIPTPDIFIGTYCIETGAELLTADRDFLPMRDHLGLRLIGE